MADPTRAADPAAPADPASNDATAPTMPWPVVPGLNDPETLTRACTLWMDTLSLWQRALDPRQGAPAAEEAPDRARDKRFRDAVWREHPVFDWIRRSYLDFSDRLIAGIDTMEGLSPREQERLRFATRNFVQAISPTNFPLTNPKVLEETVKTGGENLVRGMERLMADLNRGQITHTEAGRFEVGRDIATTPGQVVHRTPLYELIQYSPTTERVMTTPLVIFPPWINRFYILDLSPEKSFIRWAVEQGITVFVVSWKSADATMKDVVWDDYVAAQLDAIDTIRTGLDVPSVHAIGYCVAGTTLAATLSVLAAEDRADRVASATFFTAQVDFSKAGELLHFVDDDQLAMLERLSADGYLDGRYMAATFNLLRANDLIWNYVTNNYLLGQDYAAFDLLHWNGDTTNLPGKWHQSYLRDLYRDNLLVQPGALSVGGTPIDLTRVATPAYIQAGREDHIAPAESVWEVTRHFRGPLRFVLAGSGHIAGVVNPPSSGKYQYWINPKANEATSLAEFVEGAEETRGSWWPDWLEWLRARDGGTVPATGARLPGEGSLAAIEPAPGSYVRAR
jgi:polyhydroxyalkanoate synthase